jgi:hypothetical protein
MTPIAQLPLPTMVWTRRRYYTPLRLMALYPQPAQRTSGVDYVPVPYHPEAPPQPQRAPAARRKNARVN